jgi:hypothetical protein
MKTKKLLFIFVFIGSIALNVDAQTQPPNAGFETWAPIGSYENPDSWSSFNNFYIYGIPEMSFKTTDVNSGVYALRLISETAIVPPPLGTNVLDTLAGFVFLGGADFNNPGISYSERPVLMQAYIKGTIAPGGNAILMATLRKWNTVTHVRDQVGMAIYNMTSSSSNYTQISVPFNYSLPDTPDTLEIKVMAGDVGPGGLIMPGNEFFVDDISFTFTVGINENSKNNPSITVFPNPTSDKVSVSSSGIINTIEIYNMLGEKVYSTNNFKQSTSPADRQVSNEIYFSNLQNGVYFIKIYDGEKFYSEKIVKQ